MRHVGFLDAAAGVILIWRFRPSWKRIVIVGIPVYVGGVLVFSVLPPILSARSCVGCASDYDASIYPSRSPMKEDEL
jgi:hypothetical protein